MMDPTVISPLRRIFTNTLPAMVASAPTEMSWPPQAAVTSVMPMAMIASSEALLRMLIRLPVSTVLPRLFWAMEMLKNPGSRKRLNTTISRMDSSGTSSCA